MKKKIGIASLIFAVILIAGVLGSKFFRSGQKTTPKPEEEKMIPIQSFTCASLRTYLSQKADRNRDGGLSKEELATVTKLELNYTDKEPMHFQELNAFPKLGELTLTVPPGEIVLEKLAYIKNLTVLCHYEKEEKKRKKGKGVIIRENPQLERLQLETFDVKQVRVEQCDSLADLDCATNASSLQVHDLKSLEKLWVEDERKLKRFLFDKIYNLKELIVIDAYLIKQIDLSGLENLERFDWNWGSLGLKKIVWGKKKKLLHVNISYNHFQGVLDLDKDLPRNVSTIYCEHNKITEIRARKKKYIYSLHCRYNNLRKIDLSNTDLAYIDGSENKNVQVYLRSKSDKAEGDGAYYFDKSARVHYRY